MGGRTLADMLKEIAAQKAGRAGAAVQTPAPINWLGAGMDPANMVFAGMTHDDILDPLPPLNRPAGNAQPWIFKDKGDGYDFGPSVWKNGVALHGKQYMANDALAHRHEALRRLTVCRLEDRALEVEHWGIAIDFLTKICNLPPLKDK